MREPAVMGEAENRAFEVAQDIEIRSFSSNRDRRRRQRCLAVHPGATHARAGQKVCNGFQSLRLSFYVVPKSQSAGHARIKRLAGTQQPATSECKRLAR